MIINVWDIVYTPGATIVNSWKVTGQKSKTIFYVQSTLEGNPKAQKQTHELRFSELMSFEDAKKTLLERKTKEYDKDLKRIKALVP